MPAPPVIRLLRPKQWTKNLLVFTALIFTAGFTDWNLWRITLLAFVVMCLVSSATYIFNDLFDAERDKRHPIKSMRPIASGQVQKGMALALAMVLLVAGLGIAALLNMASLIILIVYLALQAIYNGGLKRVPIADVFLISIGFILRAALGAAALEVRISSWLLFCTGALALLLGFAKRRNEFIMQGEDRAASRESLGGYNRQVLDAMVIMFAAGAALCYGIYAIESETARRHPALILTTVFVFYGICRYVYLVFASDEGGEPESLFLRDPHLIGSVALFIATSVVAMSGLRMPLLESPPPREAPTPAVGGLQQ
jgi:4-hydroxybenzoate polyprenyltransferase